MALPDRENQRWLLDFVPDPAANPQKDFGELSNGRRFRVLAVVDDFTRECPGLVADISLSGLLAEVPSVVHLLSNLAAARQIIEAWMTDYNRKRPHSSRDGLTPAAFATRLKPGHMEEGLCL